MGDESLFILGFDILPGHSPRASTVPKFACVSMLGSATINEYPVVSRTDFLRLVREMRPRYVATDNIFEIVPDSKALLSLVDRIPTETRIVQVTGVPPHQVPLKSLARRHGIDFRGKPTPLESARVAAQLASLGVGYVLEYFSEQTEIKVTRGRKMGRGGQSVNRYRRKIHSEIQQMTRHIEDQLKGAGIDFELDVRVSDFGYASARFVASAPLPVIRGLVEPRRGGDFNVLVSPVRKRAEFLPLEPQPVRTDTEPKYFIVGVDPGTTAALCLFMLDGQVCRLESRKGLTRSEMVRMIYEFGIPVILATDKTPVPHLVKKLAAALDIELFIPSRPIPVSEKQEIAREMSQQCKIANAHERDALTAAIYAYRHFLPKLDQIDHRVREEQLHINRNRVKALVLKGRTMNEAITTLTRPKPEVPELEAGPATEAQLASQESAESLKERVNTLQSQNRILDERIDDLERLVEFLRFRESEAAHSLEIVSRENYWRVKRDREIAKKQSELRSASRQIVDLQRENEKLSLRLEMLRGVKRREMKGDMIAVKAIPHFTREEIEDYVGRVGLKANDIVLLEDASGGGAQTAALLIQYGVRAVIADGPISHLAEQELVKAAIPVIDAQGVELQRVDEFAFVSRRRLEDQLQDFMREAKERARQKGEDKLVEMIERYRREIER